ncbi:hypothetical protein P171DRAFT_35218 [Karstenula rhodostoma CBS 690.94]|uniref:Uncharacterized protein n=1 Tax=Karstenula rhodostoma CBS 690.94 TaxID=1392251 RepID=A0A9P4UAQ4_9PLEO|nr:hypothetical protein P171DRAFT_35218 [Karstenula rhodostoma CBS 690.94]
MRLYLAHPLVYLPSRQTLLHMFVTMSCAAIAMPVAACVHVNSAVGLVAGAQLREPVISCALPTGIVWGGRICFLFQKRRLHIPMTGARLQPSDGKLGT